MKISIFGLGYVGTVLTGCFARNGHHVIGVDTDPLKVQLVNNGKSPVIEPDLEPLISQGVLTGRIRATSEHEWAVMETELSMICVGTPSDRFGDLDLRYVINVCEAVGGALRKKSVRHVVVVRSTMLPGSVRKVVIPTLEKASGKKAGADFGVVFNPEFLRESSAVYDFYNPPKTVIGALFAPDAEVVASLYSEISAPLIRASIEVAEMVKYVDNTFHALKVTFANEIGALCKPLNIDSREVMDIFCQDRKLNISAAYFKPGFAFGGSCLPKDLRALNRLARALDVTTPLLGAISVSNEQHIKNALQLIQEKNRRRIGVLGFAFKAGTDDLRESPVVALVEALLGKGYELKIYDADVSLSKLIGANRRYLQEHIPHVSRLMVDSIAELISHAELIVIGKEQPEFYNALAGLNQEQFVIDLTAHSGPVSTPAKYERLCG